MTEATLTWSIWQALLNAFACCFTRRGFPRFAEWITAMALNVEEHTITQSVLALEQPGDWKALEAFAEYGSWHADRVTWALTRLIETAPGRIWYGYQVSAVDDTKVHRTSPHVWGTCTFHEYTARCPNRAATVRAHNWVVLGGLLHEPAKPGLVPADRRLALLPPVAVAGRPRRAGGSEPFRTKCDLAVELAPRPGPDRRRQAPGRLRRRLRPAKRGPAVGPARGRLAPHRVPHAVAARRPAGRPARRRTGPRGSGAPKPKWGKKLPPPRQGGRWAGPWHVGFAFVYGRLRRIRWKEVVCLWRVSGHDVPVKAIVAEVEGYKKRFTLVTSATELTGAADGGVVRRPIPARGRLPRPEAAAGLGGMPGLDEEPDRADHPGAVGDDEPAAAVAVPAGGGPGRWTGGSGRPGTRTRIGPASWTPSG